MNNPLHNFAQRIFTQSHDKTSTCQYNKRITQVQSSERNNFKKFAKLFHKFRKKVFAVNNDLKKSQVFKSWLAR